MPTKLQHRKTWPEIPSALSLGIYPVPRGNPIRSLEISRIVSVVTRSQLALHCQHSAHPTVPALLSPQSWSPAGFRNFHGCRPAQGAPKRTKCLRLVRIGVLEGNYTEPLEWTAILENGVPFLGRLRKYVILTMRTPEKDTNSSMPKASVCS